MRWRPLLLGGLLASASGAVNAQQPAALPPGAGVEIVSVACTQCHGLNAFVDLRQGVQGWRLQVYDMILRGAQIQPADVDIVVTYLASHFGIGNPLPGATSALSPPDGVGKDLVEQRCTLCHGLDRAIGTRRTRPEWDAIVARMLRIGAPISPGDARTIGAYLKDKISL